MSLHPYPFHKDYSKPIAYFSMEFAIHQALKIYSGGLGFLAGSHMRSAYDLKQNIIGVGILWSYGYYDQARDEHRNLKIEFRRKHYYFLEDLNIKVSVQVNGKPVTVKAFMLPAETFGSAPLILLSTDVEENDYLSRTITHKLYDTHEETRIAQEIVLGIGGVKVLEALDHKVDIYHMNEGHALPMAFELYHKYPKLNAIKERIRFTTHTPEAAGNEIHDIHLLQKMGFFNSIDLEKVRELTQTYDDNFSLTVGALRVAKIANAVSEIHAKVANSMWNEYQNICKIIAITNAQNKRYWADKSMLKALEENNNAELIARKKHLKRALFNTVANQTGKMFHHDVLTIVWARRFAEYKRPGLLKYDFERFKTLINNTKQPVQIIWAGKPYPFDTNAINIFNELTYIARGFKNIAVLIGYELELSMTLKKGCDVWLNTPRITREASGTSGMTAAMNGAINFSIADGWHPEFCKDKINSFTILGADASLSIEEQDKNDNKSMMDILENEIIPTYYNDQEKWINLMKNSMNDVLSQFDSGSMADQYYKKMYTI
ncbi:alpha-glucan family phosphorylase [bacterium]|nr:alpha-glucan family phosphorylase [bacterium]MBU1957945.1 alpha-glucan family phosphorylase [bacterium]